MLELTESFKIEGRLTQCSNLRVGQPAQQTPPARGATRARVPQVSHCPPPSWGDRHHLHPEGKRREEGRPQGLGHPRLTDWLTQSRVWIVETEAGTGKFPPWSDVRSEYPREALRPPMRKCMLSQRVTPKSWGLKRDKIGKQRQMENKNLWR